MREKKGNVDWDLFILYLLGVSMYSIYTILPLHRATLVRLEAVCDIWEGTKELRRRNMRNEKDVSETYVRRDLS